jgi:hypothetical protein
MAMAIMARGPLRVPRRPAAIERSAWSLPPQHGLRIFSSLKGEGMDESTRINHSQVFIGKA